MAKNSFLLHVDSLVILDKMTDEQAGIFIKILYDYKKTGELPELDFAMNMAVTPFINQFSRDDSKYEKIVERNRDNGSKGGRPKEPSGLINNPLKPKKADNDSDNDSDSDNVNVNVNDKENKFETFWNLYDNKTDRKKCFDKWNKLKEHEIEKILATVADFKKHKPFPTYNHPNPLTYLNGQRWNDVLPAKQTTPVKEIRECDFFSRHEYETACKRAGIEPKPL